MRRLARGLVRRQDSGRRRGQRLAIEVREIDAVGLDDKSVRGTQRLRRFGQRRGIANLRAAVSDQRPSVELRGTLRRARSAHEAIAVMAQLPVDLIAHRLHEQIDQLIVNLFVARQQRIVRRDGQLRRSRHALFGA